MKYEGVDLNRVGIRTIQTARDEESINLAAKNGFFPLMKKVAPDKRIRSKYAIFQNKETGEIRVSGDYRSYDYEDKKFKPVIDFTFYYPHHFPSPFAAYLIPNDLRIGERVFIEDLIEDYIRAEWNQGDVYRLESSFAIWNGDDFEVLNDPSNQEHIVG